MEKNVCVDGRKVEDVLRGLENGRFAYTGEMGRSIDFIKSAQLGDRRLWRKFVDQFRIRADAKNDGWSGEFWGKMMRGACVVYTYDGDETLYAILKESVEDMLSVQDEQGRISTYAPDHEFAGWDLWVRKYVMIGLEYFYDICRDDVLKTAVLSSLCRQADYIMAHIGAEDGKIQITDTSKAWGCVNSCSILEAMTWLYAATEKRAYLDFIKYIVETGGCKEGNLVETALENTRKPHEYPARKAYEITSFFNGVLETYRITGEEKYLQCVENFAKGVWENDLSIIGCCGCDEELFDNSSLTQTEWHKISQETCVTVTWIQLCYELLRLTGKARYAELIERSAYNALYASVNYAGNKDAYYIPDEVEKIALPFDSYNPLVDNRRGIVPAGYRLLHDQTYYGCCACIGSLGLGLIPKLSVMQSADGFTFQLYETGTVEAVWKGADVRFSLKTLYPQGDGAQITVQSATPIEMELKLRVPTWSVETSCSVNGELCEDVTDGYFRIRRVWRSGDTIALTYASKVELIELNGKIAVKKGAIVMARDERFGEPMDEAARVRTVNGEVQYQSITPTEFSAKEVLRLECEDGKFVHVCDYASAGDDWKDGKNKVTVWMSR